MNSVHWEPILSLDSIDNAAEAFSNQLMCTARQCMPVKEIIVNKIDAPWTTNEIKNLIKKKNNIHKVARTLNSAQAWALFRRTRNELTAVIRRRKIE